MLRCSLQVSITESSLLQGTNGKLHTSFNIEVVQGETVRKLVRNLKHFRDLYNTLREEGASVPFGLEGILS